MNSAWVIADTLDRHFSQPTELVVFGSAALLLDRPFAERLSGKMTNDIDLIVPSDREMAIDADPGFWRAIEAANRELDPQGFYISHIFPEREVILTPDWRRRVVSLIGPWKHIEFRRPGILDLILSKMGRGDIQDLDDIENMLRLERAINGHIISGDAIAKAAAGARVPEVYQEIFPLAREKIVALARRLA